MMRVATSCSHVNMDSNVSFGKLCWPCCLLPASPPNGDWADCGPPPAEERLLPRRWAEDDAEALTLRAEKRRGGRGRGGARRKAARGAGWWAADDSRGSLATRSRYSSSESLWSL